MPRCPTIMGVCSFIVLLSFYLCPSSGFATQHMVLQLPWHHQYQFAGYYMAEELGYYRTAGIELKIRSIEQGGDSVEAVLAGNADFGVSSSGLLVEYSQGEPLVAVATILQESPIVWLVLEESGITKPQDLIGKKVMISPRYGSLSLLSLLHQQEISHQVIKRPTSYNLDSLFSGETDAFNAYRTNEPFLAQEQGYRVSIIDPADYGISFYGDTLFTRSKLAVEKPYLVEQMRQATLKGWQYALDHPQEAIRLLQEKYQVTKSLASLSFEADAIHGAIQPDKVPIGHMDIGRWAQMTYHLISIGQIEPGFSLKSDFLFQPPKKLDWSRLTPWIVIALTLFGTLMALLSLLARANLRVKTSLKSLESSEQRYRQLVENTPGLIYSCAPETAKATCLSPQLEETLGYTAGELQEHTCLWHDLIHPLDRDKVRQLISSMDFDKNREIEYRIKNADGNWLWFSDRLSKRLDPIEGEIIDGIATDITARKLAEQQKQKLDQMLRDALNAVSDGIWEWNIQTGEATVDQHSKAIFGFSPEENPSSEELFARVDRNDIGGVKTALEKHIRGETDKYDHQFKINRPDGEVRWVRGRGRCIETDLDGTPLKIIGTNTDVTDQVVATLRNKQSERRFRDLIEQVVGIAIQGYDEQRKVIFWNKASEEIYGYSETEAMGRQLEDLIIPEQMRDEVIRLVNNWIENGESIPAGELVLVGKNGQDVPVFSSHVMRETPTGKEMFCIDIDLKPLKEVEAQRHDLEEQLRQKYKMEAIGTMAGGIAHDFNNQLAIILGSAELAALKLPEDSPVRKYVEQVKVTANRSKELVKQILVYSRRNPQELIPVCLADVIDETVQLLRPTIPSSIGLGKTVDETSRNCLINADPIQLQQILLNLSNNAVQAIGEKGWLRIALVPVGLSDSDLPQNRDLKPGRYLLLSVEDNGCGITPEVLGKIFDPFFTTKEVHKGTGMGLSVVQGIVLTHQGFIKVASETGKGSRFDVFFPVSGTREALQQEQEIAKAGGNERILVLDDEEELAQLCSRMLEEYGYQVTTSTSSEQVLELFRSNPQQFDLLISDQTMPKLSGSDLAAQLLKIRPDLPIILCTGYSRSISDIKALNLGIRKFCMKPLNLPELLQATRAVLDEKQRDQSRV